MIPKLLKSARSSPGNPGEQVHRHSVIPCCNAWIDFTNALPLMTIARKLKFFSSRQKPAGRQPLPWSFSEYFVRLYHTELPGARARAAMIVTLAPKTDLPGLSSARDVPARDAPKIPMTCCLVILSTVPSEFHNTFFNNVLKK